MYKLFALFAVAVLGMAFVSCGDDKDEPVKPEPVGNLESVCEDPEHDTHYLFDIDLDKDSSSIYIYNVQFAPNAPLLTIRIDAPVIADRSGKIYSYSGTGIMPYMQRGSVFMPMPGENYLVTDLLCNVNTEAKTYDIKFYCHGGHFKDAGRLK